MLSSEKWQVPWDHRVEFHIILELLPAVCKNLLPNWNVSGALERVNIVNGSSALKM